MVSKIWANRIAHYGFLAVWLLMIVLSWAVVVVAARFIAKLPVTKSRHFDDFLATPKA